jgi:peptidoglycan/LPS O-acetylase OafA/YrhL
MPPDPGIARSATLPRYNELDSLRGLAALTVVFHHFFYLVSHKVHLLVLHGPLRILDDGHQAVILFFMLSGFVLTLPYSRRRELDYRPFMIKRLCRIYLPYLAALALSIAGDLFTPSLHTNNRWIDRTWSQPVTLSLVLEHVLFLGNYDWPQFNIVFWSLIYEMRISIVFPFLALAVLRVRSQWALGASFALSISSLWLSSWLDPSHNFLHSDHPTADALTLHYTAFFIIGAVLAKNLAALKKWFERITIPWQVSLSFLAVLLYGYPLLDRIVNHFNAPQDIVDYPTGAGAAALIILALHAKPFRLLLSAPSIHHLGTVSYSLYLVHGTVLFGLIHTCLGRIPVLVIFLLYLPITLLATELFYRTVERPTLLLGRKLTSRGNTAQALASQSLLAEVPRS